MSISSDDANDDALRAMEARLMKRVHQIEALADAIRRRIPSCYTPEQFAEITGMPLDVIQSECYSGKLDTLNDEQGEVKYIPAYEADRYLPWPWEEDALGE